MCVADLLELKRHALRVDLHAQVREQPGASGRTVSPGGLSTRIFQAAHAMTHAAHLLMK
jgi:hypothetical protein